MNIFEYLDAESPEINHALAHGFRKGDSSAVGRALLEEIRARKTLVKQLATQVRAVEAVDRQTIDTSGLQANIDQQGETLNQQRETLSQQGETLSQQGETLSQQGETLSQQGETLSQQIETLSQQGETLSQQQESINEQLELINLQQELIDQQQEESSNQLLKIGELEQDVADANSRIDVLISGLTSLLQRLE